MKTLIEKIVSGGQTGVDRAALDLAIEFGIPHGGWCPLGRLAEDGIIGAQYQLKETLTAVYAERTELNARDSDGTLILYQKPLSGGTALTLQCAKKYSRPFLLLDLDMPVDRAAFKNWLETNGIKVLNIAGPRESHAPGQIYRRSYACLRELVEL